MPNVVSETASNCGTSDIEYDRFLQSIDSYSEPCGRDISVSSACEDTTLKDLLPVEGFRSVAALQTESLEVSQSLYHQTTEMLSGLLKSERNSPGALEWNSKIDNLLNRVRSDSSSTLTIGEVQESVDKLSVWIGQRPAVLDAGKGSVQLRKDLLSIVPQYFMLHEAIFGNSGASSDEFAIYASRQITHQISKFSDTAPVAEISSNLKLVTHIQGAVKSATDFPKITADGVVRSRIFTQFPDMLRTSRTSKGLDPDVCEVVIIGGGPAGIASAYNLGRSNIDTVLFEAGYLAQGMSDSRAKSVHVMRTNAQASSLFRKGLVPDEIFKEVGMPEVLKKLGLRSEARSAREALERQSKDRPLAPEHLSSPPEIQYPRDYQEGEYDDPVTRAEVFSYFQYVAERAACLSCSILEQAPVTTIRKGEDGLFEVRTAEGHQIKAKKLIVASGFVGPDGEFTRAIPDLEQLVRDNPERIIPVQNDNDLARVVKSIECIPDRLHNGHDQQETVPQLFLSDLYLGREETRGCIEHLPADSLSAVVGSGESAAKAALEILSINPDSKVALFVKGRLEPSQFQFAVPRLNGDFVVRGLREPGFGRELLKHQKSVFGTPITPDTMEDVLKEVRKGRIKVYELGEYFSEDTLDLTSVESDGRAALKITIDPNARNVSQNLLQQQREWKKVGLLPEDTSLVHKEGDRDSLCLIDGVVVIAAGYNRQRLHSDHPIMRQLLDAGLMDLNDRVQSRGEGEVLLDTLERLKCTADPDLYLVGADNMQTPTDGAFAGIGARAYLVSEQIAAELKGQDRPEILDELDEKVSQWQQDDRRLLLGSTPSELWSSERRFPGNTQLIALSERQAQGYVLTPEQELILSRADALETRSEGHLSSYFTKVWSKIRTAAWRLRNKIQQNR
jgi:hypothetical protein